MITHASSITPEDLHPYSDLGEMARTLAYAELRAVMVARVGNRRRAPAELVRTAIDVVLGPGKPAWHWTPRSFGAHLREVIRAETGLAVLLSSLDAAILAREHGEPPPPALDTRALDATFHLAGELAGKLRVLDPRGAAVVAALTDHARDRAARSLDDTLDGPSPEPN
ncbi:MAG: hypothetical protein HS111_39840 [Kofleriaceae bacterium]|nr:hypothetical protein [Kofleriaceae bacterium]MCL4228647.1 hypothetical protein [Myxococcales bacterium]